MDTLEMVNQKADNVNMRYLLFIFIVACAKAPSAPAAGPKTIASHWQSTSSPNWALDFSGASYTASFQIREGFWTGGICESTASIAQTTTSPDTGTMTISASFQLAAGFGDPPCTMFNGAWPYAVSADGVMTLFYAPTNQTIVFE